MGILMNLAVVLAETFIRTFSRKQDLDSIQMLNLMLPLSSVFFLLVGFFVLAILGVVGVLFTGTIIEIF